MEVTGEEFYCVLRWAFESGLQPALDTNIPACRTSPSAFPGAQTGFSREYLEKVVRDEQAEAATAPAGVEYEYNTEVRAHSPLLLFVGD